MTVKSDSETPTLLALTFGLVLLPLAFKPSLLDRYCQGIVDVLLPPHYVRLIVSTQYTKAQPPNIHLLNPVSCYIQPPLLTTYPIHHLLTRLKTSFLLLSAQRFYTSPSFP